MKKLIAAILLVPASVLARPAIPEGTDPATAIEQLGAGRQKANGVFALARPLLVHDFQVTGARVTETGDVQTTDPKGGKMVFEIPASFQGSNLKLQTQFRLDSGGAVAVVSSVEGVVARALGQASGAGNAAQGSAAFDVVGANPFRVIVRLSPNTRLHWISGAIYRRSN